MSDLWLHGHVAPDEAASAEAARAAGVSAIVAAGSSEQAERLRSLGLRPWACIGAFSVGAEDPSPRPRLPWHRAQPLST